MENKPCDDSGVMKAETFIGKALQSKRRIFGDKSGKESLGVQDILPEEVKLRIEKFNKTLNYEGNEMRGRREKEAFIKDKRMTKEDSVQVDTLFYDKASKLKERLKKEKAHLANSSMRNLRLFIVIVICFGAFFAYRYWQDRDPWTAEVIGLSQMLPYKFDEETTLVSISDKPYEFIINLEKSSKAFDGLSLEDKDKKITNFIQQGKNLCSISLFSRAIDKGKKIIVHITDDKKSFEKSITVASCEQTK